MVLCFLVKSEPTPHNFLMRTRGLHMLARPPLGQAWALKLDPMNKWVALGLKSRKAERDYVLP